MNNTIRTNFSSPSIGRILSKPITSSSSSSSCCSSLTTPRIKFRRRYHSYQHPAPGSPFTKAESAILSASLLHVPSHGFSNAALSFGARDANYLDISVNMLPRGVFDLVHYHLATERLRLGDKIDFRKPENELPEGLRNLSIPAKIRVLCMERLRANAPIIHRWQEAFAVMSLAGNISASMSELAKLSDEIWFLAGDESHDTTWYTRRATLSAVYATTELFMTQDNSKDFEATWAFLDRRLHDVKTIGSSVSNVTSYLDFTVHAFANVLRSKNVPFF
ncbi:ubiquinone biosynthesis protein COQ9 [Choiromyces venosus 120613-1]|uniref:Ubiquinone biosynthesis protein n=1 Tax=Choiromyces venosus 120613-1 TaxID=1336337 RepID=A0A3N4JCQ7_9PEZI|nr:ubiquinone biosynthesis protein COQ9 [Choiromyces venosus 120613-1]